jgi:hypothetical protein
LGYVVDKVAESQIVQQVLRLSLVTIIPLRIHTHIILPAMVKGRVVHRIDHAIDKIDGKSTMIFREGACHFLK